MATLDGDEARTTASTAGHPEVEAYSDGVSTWRYVGPHLYCPREEPDGPMEWVVPDLVLTGMDPDPDTYFGVGGTTRVDADGNEWVLVAVDREAFEEKRAAYDARVEAEFGREPGEPVVAAWEVNDDAGEVLLVEPAGSWFRWNCDSEPYIFERTDEPLFEVGAPMNSRQRKILFLADEEYCSGVMVDEDTLLTAGHCTESYFNDQQWCTMENLDENTVGSLTPTCHEVDDFVQNEEWYGGDEGVENDYALVHLETEPGVGWMPLSTASALALFADPDFVRGYPRAEYDCNTNQISNDALTTDDSHNGRVMMGADGDVSDVFLDHIRWDTSSASGMSGGPHFHCPSGDCAVGHWITGVTTHAYVSGCTPWTNPELCSSGYSTGPRASTIRDWVIANM